MAASVFPLLQLDGRVAREHRQPRLVAAMMMNEMNHRCILKVLSTCVFVNEIKTRFFFYLPLFYKPTY